MIALAPAPMPSVLVTAHPWIARRVGVPRRATVIAGFGAQFVVSTASPDTCADVLGVATHRAASSSEPHYQEHLLHEAVSKSVVLTVENTGETLTPQLVSTLGEPFRRGSERIRTEHARSRPRPGNRPEHHPGTRRNPHPPRPRRWGALRHGATTRCATAHWQLTIRGMSPPARGSPNEQLRSSVEELLDNILEPQGRPYGHEPVPALAGGLVDRRTARVWPLGSAPRRLSRHGGGTAPIRESHREDRAQALAARPARQLSLTTA